MKLGQWQKKKKKLECSSKLVAQGNKLMRAVNLTKSNERDGFQVKAGEKWEVNISNLAPLILHGKWNLEHTTVMVLGRNLLVTKLNKLHFYLAILFQRCFSQELGIGNW